MMIAKMLLCASALMLGQAQATEPKPQPKAEQKVEKKAEKKADQKKDAGAKPVEKTKKKQMKRFDVFVAEGDPVSADELPKVTMPETSSAGSQQ